jgi:Tol biopolymer transport system component
MGLATGTKLGPYEIHSALGAGGMGEVYRARDTRLDRVVAIKVLPAHLSSDPALRQRLDREAKAASRLSHPYICTLHDVGHQNGLDYLVMELVEGDTLEHRLTKGPLPPQQATRIAAQLAEALASAHRLGIVHRDIKPSNVMLTRSGAKLMDFGLAKDFGPAPVATVLTEMTAENAKLTAEGTIIGTFQYMAPEQLEGKEADARTDIFALGEVIYEMVTGKPAFSGKSRASLIAAILTADPRPITELQPCTPAPLQHVVEKCLAKDPEDRWQSASDLATELTWIAEAEAKTAASPHDTPFKRWTRLAYIALAALPVLLLLAGFAWWYANRVSASPMYFHAAVPFAANDVALSPNGHTVAMVAYSPQHNNYVLWTQDIGGRRTTPLDGTQGASFPFWSPDGRFIAFFAGGKLKKVEAAGAQPQVLCDAPYARGGTWNKDGVIVFAPKPLGGLFTVSSLGGSPKELSKPDLGRFESSHRWPMFLPDGKHFLYLAANFSGKFDYNAIFVGSLDSPEKHFVVSASSNAAYVEPGYLLYLRDRTLVAQPFDLRGFSLKDQPHSLSDEVLYFSQVDRAAFSANSDVLVAQTGRGASISQLTWYDRSGKELGLIGKPTWYNNVSLSPDGRRVAVDQTDPDGRNTDVWIYEPARGTSIRTTFDPGLDDSPVWGPEGKQILFGSNRTDLGFGLYLKNADGSGQEQELTKFDWKGLSLPWDWSRDGKYVLVKLDNELWYFSMADRVSKRLLPSEPTVRNAQFSSDGRWIAYASNESGTMEVYVSPFPSARGKWQLSRDGGEEPRWRRDGKELFYLSPDGKIMAVAISTGATFDAGVPVPLFQTHRRQAISSQDVFSYDVAADGHRFLVETRIDEPKASPMSVLLNWSAEMKK